MSKWNWCDINGSFHIAFNNFDNPLWMMQVRIISKQTNIFQSFVTPWEFRLLFFFAKSILKFGRWGVLSTDQHRRHRARTSAHQEDQTLGGFDWSEHGWSEPRRSCHVTAQWPISVVHLEANFLLLLCYWTADFRM